MTKNANASFHLATIKKEIVSLHFIGPVCFGGSVFFVAFLVLMLAAFKTASKPTPRDVDFDEHEYNDQKLSHGHGDDVTSGKGDV